MFPYQVARLPPIHLIVIEMTTYSWIFERVDFEPSFVLRRLFSRTQFGGHFRAAKWVHGGTFSVLRCIPW